MIWSASRRRRARAVAATLAVTMLLVLATFALPIDSWRTGHGAWTVLQAMQPGQRATLPRRVWIDTDAACGQGRWHDPDDCLALLALLGRSGVQVVGVSTVFGNAALATTHAVTRALIEQVAVTGGPAIPVFRGCEHALPSCLPSQPAHVALRTALQEGPLTVLALGPLTNIAAALGAGAPPSAHAVHLVAVMGRRPGHRFHPTEGRSERAVLFGHGPVFRDLNFVLDPAATAVILSARIPLTLIPYEAARSLVVTEQDLERIADRDAAGAWVAARSRDWLDRWQQAIGLNGFYPFDLAAAMVLVLPEHFDCAQVQAWVGRDPRLTVFERAPALLVSQELAPPREATAFAPAVYCTGVQARVGDVL